MAGIKGIGLLKVLGLAVTLFIGDRNMAVQFIKATQGVLFKAGLMLHRRNITKGDKNSIAGVVMVLVKRLKLIVGQIRNIGRLTTAVVMISAGGIQVLAHGLPQHRVNGAHGTFHFIVNHPFKGQLRRGVAGISKLQTMALLGKIQWVQSGKKYRVQIHTQQIVKVLFILAGKGISRPVTAGKRIHKGVERTPNHHKEWVAHRVLLTATERRMLKNMGHTGRVHRHSAQSHQKNILAVVCRQMNMLGTGHAVTKLLVANF